MRIFWTKLALSDFDSEMFFIFQHNQFASKNISERIFKNITFLEKNPLIGRTGRVAGTRELIVSNISFVIPYRLKGDDIEILRVFNSARNRPDNFLI